MTSHNKQKALLSRPRKKKIEEEESWRPESEVMRREDEETASCAVSSSEEKEKEEQDQKEVSQRTSACKYRRSSVADLDPNLSDPYVFLASWIRSGSISQRYGPGSFYLQAKIVRKTLILTAL
jgi:hypothetical protein